MNKLENKIKLKAFDDIYRIKVESKLYIWSIVIFLVLLVIMLLPWTQNIRSKGNITSLNQEMARKGRSICKRRRYHFANYGD